MIWLHSPDSTRRQEGTLPCIHEQILSPGLGGTQLATRHHSVVNSCTMTITSMSQSRDFWQTVMCVFCQKPYYPDLQQLSGRFQTRSKIKDLREFEAVECNPKSWLCSLLNRCRGDCMRAPKEIL